MFNLLLKKKVKTMRVFSLLLISILICFSQTGLCKADEKLPWVSISEMEKVCESEISKIRVGKILVKLAKRLPNESPNEYRASINKQVTERTGRNDYYRAGELCYLAQQYAEAERHLLNFCELQSKIEEAKHRNWNYNSGNIYILLAQCKFQLQQNAAAADYLDSAHKKAGDNKHYKHIHNSADRTAKWGESVKSRNDNIQNNIKKFNQDPTNGDLLWEASRENRELDRWVDERTLLMQLITLCPTNSKIHDGEALYALAETNYNLYEYEAAIEILKSLEKSIPQCDTITSGQDLMLISKSYQRMGDIAKANLALTELGKQREESDYSKNGDWLWDIACNYYNTRDNKNAINAYRRYINDYPNSKKVGDAHKRIDKSQERIKEHNKKLFEKMRKKK